MRGSEVMWDRSELQRDWRAWADRITQAAAAELGSDLLGVYAFGSAVSGRAVASSDVDLLIVAKRLPKSFVERSEIKLRISDGAGLPTVNPFELHLVDEEGADAYHRHIGDGLVRI